MTTPLTSAENCQYFSYNFQSFRHSSANNILSKTFLVSRSGQHCWCAHQIFLTLYFCWIVPGEQFYLSPSSEIARLESYEKWHWCVCLQNDNVWRAIRQLFNWIFSPQQQELQKGCNLTKNAKKGNFSETSSNIERLWWSFQKEYQGWILLKVFLDALASFDPKLSVSV